MIMLRGTLAVALALVITASLCLIAPLISSKRELTFSEPATPVRMTRLPQPSPKVQHKKPDPTKPKPLPRTPKTPIRKQPPLKQVKMAMAPLKMDLPPMRTATIPTAPPRVD